MKGKATPTRSALISFLVRIGKEKIADELKLGGDDRDSVVKWREAIY